MRFARLLLPLLLTLLLGACDNNHNSNKPRQPEPPTLDFTTSDAPIDLPNITASYAADIQYGEDDIDRFDIYMPDCDGPTPLVIYIHGGGFTGGDKADANTYNAGDIREFLASCVAYASINYTLLTVPDTGGDLEIVAAQGGVLTPLTDIAHALQFIRYYHDSLNIDPQHVALYGHSAGAGASLWLGTHDDMADPESDDPVLRESTRVSAVGALATQSTYDVLDWETVLAPLIAPFADLLGGTDVPTIAGHIGAGNYLLTFLGISSLDQIDTQVVTDYRANIDMLEMMDSGDAPIFVENYTTSVKDLLNLLLHHALHAIAVKERADEVGLESVGYSLDPAFPLEDPSGEGLVSFLTRHIR